MRVFVINHCSHNKGDRAILAFVVRELARNGVREIAVSTSNRSHWAGRQVVDNVSARFVPYGWNVEAGPYPSMVQRALERFAWYRRVAFPVVRYVLSKGVRARVLVRHLPHPDFARELARADLVLSTGGHHLTTLLVEDAVSPQVFDMAVAAAAGKRLVLWSQSVGPLEFKDPRNAALVQSLLRWVHRFYIRESASLPWLTALGVEPGRIRMTYDSVLGLEDWVTSFRLPSDRPPVVGISVYSTRRRSAQEHRRYIETMARFVDYLAGMGLESRFFPMELAGTPADDRPLIYDILQRVRLKNRSSVMEADVSTSEHLRALSDCRAFLGHKTHSVLFALVTGTPVLAIAYHPKTQQFMSDYGFPQYSLLEEDLSWELLGQKWDLLFGDLDNVAAQVMLTSRSVGEKVRADFREMISTAACV